MQEKPSGLGRRTLKDIKDWLSASQVYDLIKLKQWPYKNDMDRYLKRDLALMSIDFVGAFRNNEPLKTLLHSNFENTEPWLILHSGKISKRTKKEIAKYSSRITMRSDILFPKFKHPLQPFTDLVLNYLDVLSEKEPLFLFGERRHHQIVMCSTGQWVHWLRAMGENWYGHNVFINDPVSLAKWVGVLNIQSVMGYCGFDEQSYRKRMKDTTYADRK